MLKNLIFDWSGTLCDDLALTVEAINYVLSQYKRNALSVESFRNEFKLPYSDYYASKIPEATMTEIEAHFSFAFDNSEIKISALPYAIDFMKFCKVTGYRCFILTSMASKAFIEQSQELGFTAYFEGIHSGILNKEHYVKKMMSQHDLHPDETAFIGDMQHDINAAHHAGITSIAVLTGYNNAEQLSASKPHIIVPNLLKLRQLLERVTK